MACNENVIKNMASEITRNCQAQNVNVEVEFVVYLIGFLLNNPKYGKLFTKTLNRNNLEYFVNECVAMLTRGETTMNTLKMQFIIQVNYDKLQNLVDRHLDSIDNCLRPLINEILDADPESGDVLEVTKLYRKIAIYIVLASGMGNPSYILTLKEGMAALESVFTLEELEEFLTYPRADKLTKLKELLAVVSGVRLFNRDCKKSGEGIPDLPYNLVDAGKACIFTLSHSLIGVMQRVNSLTTAAADCISVHEETGNVYINVPPASDLTVEHYKQIIDLLSFNRQYEIYIRRLLSDIESTVQSGVQLVDSFQEVLDEIHEAVKYKEAVPVVTVFPLFTKLWQVWRSMQTTMFLISTVNRLMSILSSIQERTKIPAATLDKMLRGKDVVTDQERMTCKVSLDERLSLAGLPNYVAYSDSFSSDSRDKHVQFLGFCALCLNVGALVPSNMKIGLVKSAGRRYGFCNVKMASRFSKDPERYINEVLDYARNNPHIVSLLNMQEDVASVKDVDFLVVRYVPKTQVSNKDAQTVTHPIETHIEKNYSSNLWDWKKRACQWASIVNCQTHSTQTNYSHLRSEAHCQTVEPRDKCFQTKQDTGINTNVCSFFLWGLRGQLGDGQRSMDLVPPHSPPRRPAEIFYRCKWPCIDREMQIGSSCSLYSSSESEIAGAPTMSGDFYVPGAGKKPSLFRSESRMVRKKEKEDDK